MRSSIYLDNNASTAVDPRVTEVLINVLNKQGRGNPSSIHSFGRQSRQLLLQSRQKIASYVGVRPHEVIFTSGGTEGMNMLLRGLLPPGSRGHLVTSSVEHSCVYSTAKYLECSGLRCTFLDPGSHGAVTPDAVAEAIRPETGLITLMAVNNETGVKTDIEAIASIAEHANLPFFVDGVALMGKESFKIPLGVTGMVFSGHKFHAPKGVGFVLLRSHQKLQPLLSGGDQEYGRRAGSENLPGIAAMSTAIELLETELHASGERMLFLRNKLEKELIEKIDGVTINGTGLRVCNTSNLAFKGVEGETMLAALDLEGIAVSHGSACASGALEPSRILLKMGCSKEVAASSIRFSLSRDTTLEEIECSIECIVKTVRKLRR